MAQARASGELGHTVKVDWTAVRLYTKTSGALGTGESGRQQLYGALHAVSCGKPAIAMRYERGCQR